MSDETLYLKCRPGDVAPLVLISGDPTRVDRIAELLDGVDTMTQNREFALATGTHKGVPVTVASGGIGAPSTAIAIHELVRLGAGVIVRIGTMMGVGAPLQSVVIPTGAVRREGTSPRYLPVEFPAVPDDRLSRALQQAGLQHDLDVRRGLTATYDAFYPDMAPSLVGDRALDLALLRRARVLSMDMESALVFVMGTVLGIAASAMCLVTVQAEPHVHLDASIRADLDDRTVRAALNGLIAFGAALNTP